MKHFYKKLTFLLLFCFLFYAISSIVIAVFVVEYLSCFRLSAGPFYVTYLPNSS